MLVGYNTNVPYKGKVYHIQTEDNGIKNPVIVTLLYFHGSILASKKISYAHFAGSPDYREKVRELMKEQHKTMIKELNNMVGKGKVGFTIQDDSFLHESKKPIHQLIFSKVQKKLTNDKKAMPPSKKLFPLKKLA